MPLEIVYARQTSIVLLAHNIVILHQRAVEMELAMVLGYAHVLMGLRDPPAISVIQISMVPLATLTAMPPTHATEMEHVMQEQDSVYALQALQHLPAITVSQTYMDQLVL